jgi:uncharacterized protein (TIRG00374 family)
MKKIAIMALKILISVGLYVYILSKVNIGRLWDITKHAQGSYFLAAILLYFLVQALSAYRWYVLLAPLGLRLSFLKILPIYFLGMYSSLFLPSTIGGDVVKIYYLHKEARNLTGATLTVFLDRDLGLAAMLVMAIIASAAAGTTFNGVLLAPVFGLIFIGFLAVNLALFYRPTYNLFHRLMSLLKMKRVDEKIERMFVSINAYRSMPGVIGRAALLSVVIQFGGVFVNALAGFSVGLTTRNGIVDYLVFIPAISLITMNPISVNGMGWREAAYIILFMSAGASRDQATILSLLWLAIVVVTSLPGGLVYFLEGVGKKPVAAVADQIGPDRLPEALASDGVPMVADE